MTDTIHVGEEVMVPGFGAPAKPAEDFLKNLIGKIAVEAAKLVEEAGFRARLIHEGDRLTMDFDEGRVNLRLKGDLVDSTDVG